VPSNRKLQVRIGIWSFSVFKRLSVLKKTEKQATLRKAGIFEC
jgi:hypothetical protein